MDSSDIIYVVALTVISFMIFMTMNMVLSYSLGMPMKIAEEPNEKLRAITFTSYTSSFASFVHAVTAFIWGYKIYQAQGLKMDGPNKIEGCWLLSFSLGYFLSDTIHSWIKKYNNGVMMMHHYIVIVVIMYVFVKNEYGNIAVYSLVLAEASNPFNILRTTFDYIQGCKGLSLASGIIFAFVFIYCRFLYKSLPSTDADLAPRV